MLIFVLMNYKCVHHLCIFNFRTMKPSSAVSTMSYVNTAGENELRGGRGSQGSLGHRLGAVGGTNGGNRFPEVANTTANTLSLIKIRDE